MCHSLTSLSVADIWDRFSFSCAVFPLSKRGCHLRFRRLSLNQIFMALHKLFQLNSLESLWNGLKCPGKKKDNTSRCVRNSAAFPLLFDSYKLVIATTPDNLMIPNNSSQQWAWESCWITNTVSIELQSSPVFSIQYSVFQRGATAATDFEQGTI